MVPCSVPEEQGETHLPQVPLCDVYSRCMQRTNIYLTEDEHRLVSDRAKLENTSMAEVVRRILDKELGLTESEISRSEAIRQSAGVWSDRTDVELDELRAFRQRERTFGRR